MGVDICAQVMVDLVVRTVEVCWRRHVGEVTYDIVSKIVFGLAKHSCVAWSIYMWNWRVVWIMKRCAGFYLFSCGVLVSPSGATTSVGGVLTLVSSFVFCTFVLIFIPLFLSLPLPLLVVLFVLLGVYSSLLMIPVGVPPVSLWDFLRGGDLFPVTLWLLFVSSLFVMVPCCCIYSSFYSCLWFSYSCCFLCLTSLYLYFLSH